MLGNEGDDVFGQLVGHGGHGGGDDAVLGGQLGGQGEGEVDTLGAQIQLGSQV